MALATPNWQVDIPALSQLILSAGSNGLKQLANDGVDPHTIGCMLMIAEYTPASEEFRRSLNETRQLQRSGKASWIYKAIEIGASANFLADQLLKTRAGENVIALLSATAGFSTEPVMSSTLTALFENANVSLSDTPGVAQLARFRKALMPLLKKTGFNERMMHYHYYFTALNGNSSRKGDALASIPSGESLAKLIPMMYRVATSKEGHILRYQGATGAAWVATYATWILGLNVTAVDLEGRSNEIYYGQYQDARVIIDLSRASEPPHEANLSSGKPPPAGSATCSIHLEGKPQDFFYAEADVKPSGWTIDCSKMNVVTSKFPRIERCKDYKSISAFAAMKAMNHITQLADSFACCCTVEGNRGRWSGFQQQSLHCLLPLQERGLRILEILGFDPGKVNDFDFVEGVHCQTFRCIGLKSKRGRILADDYALRVQVNGPNSNRVPTRGRFRSKSPTWPSLSLNDETETPKDLAKDTLAWFLLSNLQDHETSFPRGPPSGLAKSFRNDFFDWELSLQDEVSATVERLAACAAKLAFTDWDESFQQLCVRSMTSRKPNNDWGDWFSRREEHVFFFDEHIRTILDLCVDTNYRNTSGLKDLPRSWIASELDGAVAIRTYAMEMSLANLDGRFVNLRHGLIRFEGAICSTIQSVDPLRNTLLHLPKHHRNDVADLIPRVVAYAPGNAVPNLSMRSLCSRERNSIWVQTEVSHKGVIRVIDDVRICKSIPHLKVSVPCIHGYRTPSKLLERFESRRPSEHYNSLSQSKLYNLSHPSDIDSPDSEKSKDYRWKVQDVLPGLKTLWETNGVGRNAYIYYQLTDENAIAQWLACHVGVRHRTLMILQKDCCIDCILTRIDAGIGTMNEHKRGTMAQYEGSSERDPTVAECASITSSLGRDLPVGNGITEDWSSLLPGVSLHICIIAGGLDDSLNPQSIRSAPSGVPTFRDDESTSPFAGFQNLVWPTDSDEDSVNTELESDDPKDRPR
ncbi:MAG: hypothetical protein M1820_002083 [Bogoriella megaspora]|nr:MAG: hypothetical protein M1820_002083 [Bogoriella megaspora]